MFPVAVIPVDGSEKTLSFVAAQVALSLSVVRTAEYVTVCDQFPIMLSRV